MAELRALPILAIGVYLYAAASAYFAAQAMRSNLPDRLSALIATGVVAALALTLWFYGGAIFTPILAWGLVIVFAAGIVITLTYTLGRYQARIHVWRERFGSRLNSMLLEILAEDRYAELLRLREKFQLQSEGRRKMPHLLMGIYVGLYLGGGWLIVKLLNPLAPIIFQPILDRGVLGASTIAATWGMMSLFLLLAPTELLRLRFPELSYPFKTVILSRLRTREIGTFGAHYYIAASAPLAAIWLTRNPDNWQTAVPAVAALLAVTVFADAASALVGVRWGRTKWFHNDGKSYLGSAGGALVALAVGLPLVGPVMAVIAAAVFVVVDAIAPVPLFVSDNLLNPIALAVTFGIGATLVEPWLPL